jgi:hypothetical protein
MSENNFEDESDFDQEMDVDDVDESMGGNQITAAQPRESHHVFQKQTHANLKISLKKEKNEQLGDLLPR